MDEPSLRRAVLESPDDDGPRLVYADWLLEHGGLRGEYIALQCKLETLGDHDPAREELVRRADALLDRHGEDWFGVYHVPGTPHGRSVIELRRGFASSVRTSSLREPLALLDHDPVEHLELVIRTHWGKGSGAQKSAARDEYLTPFAR
ncbi:MAG: TIGR02996 domain-containing protein, partial [Kofleriaceae bacterium]